MRCSIRLFHLAAAVQVRDEALYPAYRGAALQRFLAACDACTETGTKLHHYAPSAAECVVCATNMKLVRS
jgi:hypothetical protein